MYPAKKSTMTVESEVPIKQAEGAKLERSSFPAHPDILALADVVSTTKEQMFAVVQ